jgi:hypothetical protein
MVTGFLARQIKRGFSPPHTTVSSFPFCAHRLRNLDTGEIDEFSQPSFVLFSSRNGRRRGQQNRTRRIPQKRRSVGPAVHAAADRHRCLRSKHDPRLCWPVKAVVVNVLCQRLQLGKTTLLLWLAVRLCDRDSGVRLKPCAAGKTFAMTPNLKKANAERGIGVPGIEAGGISGA